MKPDLQASTENAEYPPTTALNNSIDVLQNTYRVLVQEMRRREWVALEITILNDNNDPNGDGETSGTPN